MNARALVTGGGGPAGIAWEIGVIVGLSEAGSNVREADLFIGTSGGACVATQTEYKRIYLSVDKALFETQEYECFEKGSRIKAMFANTPDSFGILLKQFRKRQHLTQQQIAKALGIHRNTIGRWEEGSFWPESKTLILEQAHCLRLSEPETRQLLDTSFITPTPVWSVPYPRKPFFTGREDLLATLHAYLRPGQQGAPIQSYALQGLGGVGKTQLALEYAYQYALAYRAVVWIGAETLEQIHASLLHIAQRLDLPECREPDQ